MAVCVCGCWVVFEPEQALTEPVVGKEQAPAVVLLGNPAELVLLLVLLTVLLELY